MEDEPEAIARRVYDALNRRDEEEFVGMLHPEIEFDSLIAEAEGATFRGRTGAHRWWALMRESMGGVEFRLVGFEDMGDDLAVTRVLASGTAAGVRVEQAMWQATEVRDGMPSWWHVCRTREEAVEAVERRRAG